MDDRNDERMEKLRQYMKASKKNGNEKQGLEKTEPSVSGIHMAESKNSSGFKKKDTLTGWEVIHQTNQVFGLQRQQKEH